MRSLSHGELRAIVLHLDRGATGGRRRLYVHRRHTNLSDYYRPDQQRSRLFTLGAVPAAAIGCVGLYGLAAFNTARRVKEIGIRKTLGASLRRAAAPGRARPFERARNRGATPWEPSIAVLDRLGEPSEPQGPEAPMPSNDPVAPAPRR